MHGGATLYVCLSAIAPESNQLIAAANSSGFATRGTVACISRYMRPSRSMIVFNIFHGVISLRVKSV